MQRRLFIICLTAVILSLLGGLGLKFALAWTEPTAAPPGDNVPAPINVGSGAQTKAGDLTVGDGTALGLTVLGGLSASNDLYLANGQAIRIDGAGTTALHIGNWGVGGTGADVSVWGNLNIGDASFQRGLKVSMEIAVGGLEYTGTPGTVNVQRLCFNTTDCRTNWPEAVNAFVDEGNVGFGPTAMLGTNDNVPLAFETNNIERMRIDENGNVIIDTDTLFIDAANNRVGIGTTAPTAPFEVEYNNTNAGQPAILIDNPNANGQDVLDFAFSGTTQARLRKARGGDFFLGTVDAGGVNLSTNNSPRMKIFGTGDVVIGDNLLSSDGQLMIRQDIAADIFNLYDGATNVFTVIDGGNVGIGTSEPLYKLVVAGDSVRTYLWALTGNPELDLGDGTDHWAIYRDAMTDQLRFWRNDNRMVITSDGNVGIGTATPAYTLEVSSTGSRAISATTSSASGDSYGVYGNASAAGAVANYGGYFFANGDFGSGVYGQGRSSGGFFEATGSGSYGVRGHSPGYGGFFTSSGNTGYGVYGANLASGNYTNYGGYFVAKGTASGTSGVYGTTSGTPTNAVYGVQGVSTGTGSGAAGVYGVTDAAANNVYGVRGYASNHDAYANYGGWFTAAGTGAGASGVYGLAIGAGTVFGVVGNASNDSNIINHGGHFEAAGAGAGTSGVEAYATNTGNVINYGGYFRANGQAGGASGVYGTTYGTPTNAVYGVQGVSTGTGSGAAGVYGVTDAAANNVYGVRGYASNPGAVTNYGGYFEAAGQTGRGVYGYAPAVGGYFGAGNNGTGVYGYATGDSGYGVFGITSGSSSRAIYGETSGVNGYGVFGANTLLSGSGYGVYGSAEGTGFGVYGNTTSADAWAGYFTGGKGLFASQLCLGTQGNCRTDWPASVSPGGANMQVQFNDSGAFGGDPGLTFDKTTGDLIVGGNVKVGKFVVYRCNDGTLNEGRLIVDYGGSEAQNFCGSKAYSDTGLRVK